MNLFKTLSISIFLCFLANSLSSQSVISFDFDCGGTNFGEGTLEQSPSGLVCYQLVFNSVFTQSFLFNGTEWITAPGQTCQDITMASLPTLSSSTLAMDPDIIAAINGNEAFACSTSNVQFQSIPTVGEWGILILALLLLIVGTNGSKQLVCESYFSV